MNRLQSKYAQELEASSTVQPDNIAHNLEPLMLETSGRPSTTTLPTDCHRNQEAFLAPDVASACAFVHA